MTDYHPTSRTAIERFFFDWFSGESLGALRLYFGFGLAAYLFSQYPQVVALDPLGAQFHFTIQIWYFKLLGIDHHVPWLDLPVFVMMLAACVCFALGRWTRPAIVVILLTMAYLKGVRDCFSGDVHHREIPVVALLVLLLLSKCGDVFGVDARRRRLPPIADWEGSWPIRAMQVYIVMFYFWALMAKLRVSGLWWFEKGGHIQEMLIARALRDGYDAGGRIVDMALSWDIAQHPGAAFAMGALVFAFELLVPLVLFIKDWRWRLVWMIGGTIFHISNFVLLDVKFYLYPFVLIAFFDMAKFHRWATARGSAPRGEPTRSAA